MSATMFIVPVAEARNIFKFDASYPGKPAFSARNFYQWRKGCVRFAEIEAKGKRAQRQAAREAGAVLLMGFRHRVLVGWRDA